MRSSELPLWELRGCAPRHGHKDSTRWRINAASHAEAMAYGRQFAVRRLLGRVAFHSCTLVESDPEAQRRRAIAAWAEIAGGARQ